MCVSGDKSGPALPALTGPGQETRVWPAEERSSAAAPRGWRPSGPAPPLPSSPCRTGRLQPLLLIFLRLQPGKATPARLRSSPAISWSVGNGLLSVLRSAPARLARPSCSLLARHQPPPAPRSSRPAPALPLPEACGASRRGHRYRSLGRHLLSSYSSPPFSVFSSFFSLPLSQEWHPYRFLLLSTRYSYASSQLLSH